PARRPAGPAFIEFDGIYQDGEVWLNGHSLGRRPYGYIPVRYEMTPHLCPDGRENILAVRADNSKQPNSRWYSGSGIYRNVRIVFTDSVAIDQWGVFIATPEISEKSASVSIKIRVRNATKRKRAVVLRTELVDPKGRKVATVSTSKILPADSTVEIAQNAAVPDPELWSDVEKPPLYKAVSHILSGGRLTDDLSTTFGIRSFTFDPDSGLFLNGKRTLLRGVCNHHDLGCLGSAVNRRGLERQLELLQKMGCNAIRTSHNPPAPELLDLCDRMGFLVMDEIFDMWKKAKNPHDYHLYFDEWHRRDLEDWIRRDRNHPSVIMWSIGNEILEQWDPSGTAIAQELAATVRSLDPTRPVTSGCNDPHPSNFIIRSGALDLIGINYHLPEVLNFKKTYPGKPCIASETTSSLATRGSYDMPSDSVRIWPLRWDQPFTEGNADLTCSAYDNCHVPWGSTHEDALRAVQQNPHVSGLFIWTGFDYLGEPTPYPWPARSSYFGIIDLAGFPKDAYYLYQSEWTDEPVLHLFPHWNWLKNDSIDVWAYTNAEEVELSLNGRPLGARRKSGDQMHLEWRVSFEPGTLKAVGRRGGKILTRELRTAGTPHRIELDADRQMLIADGTDLSFITVRILDQEGTLVPRADNLLRFKVEGEGRIAGVDNGNPVSMEPFRADYRKAFNGMCLIVVQSGENPGLIKLTAESEGLEKSELKLRSEKI
ncbi:DUF4982 domain-containing protein, partial [bacterium]|nr:DUF4982 domain-containing protein [bacterium]